MTLIAISENGDTSQLTPIHTIVIIIIVRLITNLFLFFIPLPPIQIKVFHNILQMFTIIIYQTVTPLILTFTVISASIFADVITLQVFLYYYSYCKTQCKLKQVPLRP